MSLREAAEIERQIEMCENALLESALQADSPPHGGALTLGNTSIQIVCNNTAIRNLLNENLKVLHRAYRECITHLYENLGDEEYEEGEHLRTSNETPARTEHF